MSSDGWFLFRGNTLEQCGSFLSGGCFGVELFPFQGDFLAVELFPFQGNTLAWASSRGGKALGVTKPAFPPRAPPFRARRCYALWCVIVYWQNPVCFDTGSEGIVPKNTNGRKAVCTADLFLAMETREQARCAGRFPVHRNKKIGSA